MALPEKLTPRSGTRQAQQARQAGQARGSGTGNRRMATTRPAPKLPPCHLWLVPRSRAAACKFPDGLELFTDTYSEHYVPRRQGPKGDGTDTLRRPAVLPAKFIPVLKTLAGVLNGRCLRRSVAPRPRALFLCPP